MMDDDDLVREVGALLHDPARARARAAAAAAGDVEPLLTKAAWAAATVGAVLPERAANFAGGFLDAWTDFFVNAAYAARGARLDVDMPIEGQRLYVC